MMGKCNYCLLKEIKAKAAARGKCVKTVAAPMGSFGAGVNVHIVTNSKHKKVTRGNFVAWFAEVPDRCMC